MVPAPLREGVFVTPLATILNTGLGWLQQKRQNNLKSYDLADEALDYLSIPPQWEKNGMMLLNAV
jgi:hypothetical protein